MDSSVRIEEIAADWLARRDSGRWTADDEAELQVWLKTATAHWAAYVRLRAGWEQAERLRAIGAGVHSTAPPAREEKHFVPFFGNKQAVGGTQPLQQRRNSARRFVPWAAAAAVLVTLASLVAQYGWLDGQRYETPIGGIAAIPLPDGSQATLNTNSEIRLSVNDSERRVDLRRGEVFFNVAADARRPFVVEAGERRVVVIGTQFAVRRDGEALRVIVTQGRVRVGEGTNNDLTAGHIAHIDDSSVRVEHRSVAEAEETLSWRSGFIVFQDVELAAAVGEFNRYLKQRMTIEDPSIAAIRIGGNFRLTNVEAFLRILQADFPVRVERRQDRIVLTHR